jgi:hypothetical protein
MRLPSFKICFNEIHISDLEIKKLRKRVNKSDPDFSFGSLLLERRNIIAKHLTEFGIKVDFYDSNDETYKGWKELQKNVVNEIQLRITPKRGAFYHCFTYDKIYNKRRLNNKKFCRNQILL